MQEAWLRIKFNAWLTTCKRGLCSLQQTYKSPYQIKACTSAFVNMPISTRGKEFVDVTLQNNKVVVWSKTYCPYCIKAKKALRRFLRDSKVDLIPVATTNYVLRHLSFFFPLQMMIIELDEDDLPERSSDIQEYVSSFSGIRTVPQVFINGRFIGDGTTTERLANTGKLEVMLREAGVDVEEE